MRAIIPSRPVRSFPIRFRWALKAWMGLRRPQTWKAVYLRPPGSQPQRRGLEHALSSSCTIVTSLATSSGTPGPIYLPIDPIQSFIDVCDGTCADEP